MLHSKVGCLDAALQCLWGLSEVTFLSHVLHPHYTVHTMLRTLRTSHSCNPVHRYIIIGIYGWGDCHSSHHTLRFTQLVRTRVCIQGQRHISDKACAFFATTTPSTLPSPHYWIGFWELSVFTWVLFIPASSFVPAAFVYPTTPSLLKAHPCCVLSEIFFLNPRLTMIRSCAATSPSFFGFCSCYNTPWTMTFYRDELFFTVYRWASE